MFVKFMTAFFIWGVKREAAVIDLATVIDYLNRHRNHGRLRHRP